MQETEIKDYPKKAEILFFIAYLLLLLSGIFFTGMYPVRGFIKTNAHTIATIIIAAKVLLFDRKNIRFICFAFFAFVLAQFVYSMYGYHYVSTITLAVLGAYGIPFKKIVKTYLFTVTPYIIVTIILSLVGVIPNLQYESPISIAGNNLRNSFGIIYPTDFAAFIFFIMVAFVLLFRDKLNIVHSIVGLLLTAVIFFFCKTRLDCGCMAILWIGVFFLRLLEKRTENSENAAVSMLKKIYEYLCIWSMPIAAVCMTALTLVYNEGSALLSKLNHILSGRLVLGKMGFEKYGVTFLGKFVPLVGNGGSTEPKPNYFFLDCSYLYCLLQYGMIVTFLMIFAFVIIGMRYRNDHVLLFCIAVVSLNCMVAHHLPDVSYDFFMCAALAEGGENTDVVFERILSFLPIKRRQNPKV